MLVLNIFIENEVYATGQKKFFYSCGSFNNTSNYGLFCIKNIAHSFRGYNRGNLNNSFVHEIFQRQEQDIEKLTLTHVKYSFFLRKPLYSISKHSSWHDFIVFS